MALYPYPSSAALALNNAAAALGSDDGKPKKPVLYRAGQAVGAAGSAAHNVAAAGDKAADAAIGNAVDATKLGATNFMRGVQGEPALTALPKPAADPASPVNGGAGNAPTPRLAAYFTPDMSAAETTSKLKAGGALPNFAPAGQIPVAPQLRRADGSGIDTGVTLPDGRTLPYGSMVNGVPTFSDGTSGTPGREGSIPRTMTDADIKALGGRLNVVPATAFTAPVPAFNSDNTDANVASILRSRQGGKFGITPEMNAAADLAAVTNQDARTTLGRAALNASRRAGAATTTLQRKQALDDLAGLNATAERNASLGVENAGTLQRAQAEGGNALQRQLLANEGDLARQDAANEGDLARTDLAGKYGLAGRLAVAQQKATMTPKDYQTALSKGVQAQIAEYNKNQELLPPDQRQPLTDAAITEMRAIQAKALGLRTGTDASGRRVVEINGRVMPL